MNTGTRSFRAPAASGDTLLFEDLAELIIRISDYMLESHEAVRKKVRKAMGGEVLELLNDRAIRLEREARQQGLEQGIEKGIEQGIEQLAQALIDAGLDEKAVGSVADEVKRRAE